ncbi:hypothetical protein BO70DRAFT_423046 [Aspergillus heteromorphus CBS 117.55]|uniref:Uncharacterized protein n=1 Tax=Aspergillus heteromorphus CBS 117.55 TaxID=1448321 RepID=A0A317WI11_9EURO|nr:uncharacterized protein BO70DRAFT_423046 [Aspergillus heteromorphus CBS 117.55]PWY85929.1 hypothetical protein BO70DRAFT_423046 [Aspergillus heteromorphus CBS 117.55]
MSDIGETSFFEVTLSDLEEDSNPDTGLSDNEQGCRRTRPFRPGTPLPTTPILDTPTPAMEKKGWKWYEALLNIFPEEEGFTVSNNISYLDPHWQFLTVFTYAHGLFFSFVIGDEAEEDPRKANAERLLRRWQKASDTVPLEVKTYGGYMVADKVWFYAKECWNGDMETMERSSIHHPQGLHQKDDWDKIEGFLYEIKDEVLKTRFESEE